MFNDNRRWTCATCALHTLFLTLRTVYGLILTAYSISTKTCFLVISVMQNRHKLHSVTCLFNCLFTTHLFWFLVMIVWNMHGRSNCMQNNDLPSYRFKMLFQMPNLRSVYRTTGFNWPFVTAYCLNAPWIQLLYVYCVPEGGFTLIRHKIKY